MQAAEKKGEPRREAGSSIKVVEDIGKRGGGDILNFRRGNSVWGKRRLRYASPSSKNCWRKRMPMGTTKIFPLGHSYKKRRSSILKEGALRGITSRRVSWTERA